MVTTVLAYIVYRHLWSWSTPFALMIFVPLFIVEAFLLAANLTGFFDGGYLPITVAILLATAMWTWVRGTTVVQKKSADSSVPLTSLIKSLTDSTHLAHSKGTAVFLTAERVVAPPALLHNLKHNGVLHDHNIIVTVATADHPHVHPDHQVVIKKLSDEFTRCRVTFGYMDRPNVPIALKSALKFDIMTTSFFLNRRSFKISDKAGLWQWQKRLFVGMSKTASNAPDYYRLPSERVVELGQQISL